MTFEIEIMDEYIFEPIANDPYRRKLSQSVRNKIHEHFRTGDIEIKDSHVLIYIGDCGVDIFDKVNVSLAMDHGIFDVMSKFDNRLEFEPIKLDIILESHRVDLKHGVCYIYGHVGVMEPKKIDIGTRVVA